MMFWLANQNNTPLLALCTISNHYPNIRICNCITILHARIFNQICIPNTDTSTCTNNLETHILIHATISGSFLILQSSSQFFDQSIVAIEQRPSFFKAWSVSVVGGGESVITVNSKPSGSFDVQTGTDTGLKKKKKSY